jgi:hypothetical protein
MEILIPSKRLSQERLDKLESIGFAWSAKNVRKGAKSPSLLGKPKRSPDDGTARAAARNRLNDNQWEQMCQRLAEYKEKHGVSFTFSRSYWMIYCVPILSL